MVRAAGIIAKSAVYRLPDTPALSSSPPAGFPQSGLGTPYVNEGNPQCLQFAEPATGSRPVLVENNLAILHTTKQLCLEQLATMSLSCNTFAHVLLGHWLNKCAFGMAADSLIGPHSSQPRGGSSSRTVPAASPPGSDGTRHDGKTGNQHSEIL